MLIELYGANFMGFRDEFRLSMMAADIDPGEDRGVAVVKLANDEPLRLLRSVAIYGPNASGKSTLLRAASTLHGLIFGTWRRTSDTNLQYRPFRLGPQATEPTLLGVKAAIAGHVFDYQVLHDAKRFHAEKLVRLTPSGEEVLFDRTPHGVSGTWLTMDQFPLLTTAMRSNASMLMLADRVSPTLAKSVATGILRVLEHHRHRRWFIRQHPGAAAEQAHSNKEFAAWLRSQMIAADVGVVDLVVTKTTVPSNSGQAQIEGLESDGGDVEYGLNLLHATAAEPVQFSYDEESAGTHKLVELGPLLYDLMRVEHGRTVYIDELDDSLHPTLIAGIVNAMNDAHSGACGQLVFTAHETYLIDQMNPQHLRRDQVYFTKKGADGACELYSLAEFKERNNLNIRKRYLQGRYGAIPQLGLFGE